MAVKKLEMLADKLEIQELSTLFAYAMDERDFDALDDIFMPDALFDFTQLGGISGSYEDLRKWLPNSLRMFTACQHVLTNFLFVVDGDRADGKIACLNFLGVQNQNGSHDTMLNGFWYVDNYTRTLEGWRISSRSVQKSFDFNHPSWLKAALDARSEGTLEAVDLWR